MIHFHLSQTVFFLFGVLRSLVRVGPVWYLWEFSVIYSEGRKERAEEELKQLAARMMYKKINSGSIAWEKWKYHQHKKREKSFFCLTTKISKYFSLEFIRIEWLKALFPSSDNAIWNFKRMPKILNFYTHIFEINITYLR